MKKIILLFILALMPATVLTSQQAFLQAKKKYLARRIVACVASYYFIENELYALINRDQYKSEDFSFFKNNLSPLFKKLKTLVGTKNWSFVENNAQKATTKKWNKLGGVEGLSFNLDERFHCDVASWEKATNDLLNKYGRDAHLLLRKK